MAGRKNGRPFNDQGGTKNAVTRDASWKDMGDKVFGTNLGVTQAACIIIPFKIKTQPVFIGWFPIIGIV